MSTHNFFIQGEFHPLLQSRPDPAAGANLIIPAPTNSISELIVISFQLTNDINVATRFITLTLEHGAMLQMMGTSIQPTTASATTNYIAFPAANTPPAAGLPYVPITIPRLPNFRENDNLLVDIIGKQAGDQISKVLLTWKVWLYPQ